MGRALLHYEQNFEFHWLITKPIYRNFSDDMRVLCKRCNDDINLEIREDSHEVIFERFELSIDYGKRTKLAVLASADLVTCTLLLFSGLARGIFWCKTGWLEFDAFVHLPLGSISSNITVGATVCVTIDRLAMVCRLYKLQNWVQLMIFGLLPAIFLFIANSIMCINMIRILNQRKELLKRCKAKECNQLRDQTRLTVMLVGVAFVFVIGEVPTHLASRRSAVSLLYDGDLTIVHEIFLERFRIYATLLNAISSSFNFVLYSLLSPHFLSHLKQTLCRKSVSQKSNQINIKTIVSQNRITNGSSCDLF
ncbi:hypothetical protein M0804_001222 [Polistes exclamans]|nr:hypothetical protein M0804_001222 [Polistes exclamans]